MKKGSYLPSLSLSSIGGMEGALGLSAALALGLIVLVFSSPIALIVLIGALLGLAAVWWGYEYLPLVLFLLLAFSVEVPITGDTNITLPTEVMIPGLFFLFILDTFRRGKFSYRRSGMNVAVFLLYFMTVATLVYTQELTSTVKAIIRDTGYLITGYYLIPRYVTSTQRLKHILIGCLAVHILLVFYGFYTQAVGGIRIYSDIAAPFFVEHCIYAAFLTLTLAFVAAFYLDRKPGPLRGWLGIIGVLFAAAIALTFVRAAWLSVALLLNYYLLVFRKRRGSVDLIIILFFFICIGAAVIVTTDIGRLVTQRIVTITDMKYVANYDRLERWQAAYYMWLDNPYFGVGWGAYPDVYYDYIPQGYSFSHKTRMGAHNLYLELMAEVGIVGLILYLAMIYVFFRRAIKLQRAAQDPIQKVFLIGMQGAMVTYLFHAFVNNLGPSDKISITFWFMLGMIPAMESLVYADQKAPAKAAAVSPAEPQFIPPGETSPQPAGI